jgi:hypothetical protein
MASGLASLIFEKEVDEDRASAASRGRRALIKAMAGPGYERIIFAQNYRLGSKIGIISNRELSQDAHYVATSRCAHLGWPELSVPGWVFISG